MEISKWKVGLERLTAQHVFLFDSGNISFFNEKEMPIQQKYYPEKAPSPVKAFNQRKYATFHS